MTERKKASKKDRNGHAQNVRATEASSDRESLLFSFMEHAPDGIFLSDLDGNFIFGNQQCERISGYRPEDLIGKNCFEVGLLTERGLQRVARALQVAREGLPVHPYKIELVTGHEGRITPVEVNASIVRYNDQDIILGFVRDISQRKKMEETLRDSEEKHRNIFENAHESILVAQDGRLVFFNAMATVMSGYSDEELLSKPFIEIIHEEDRKKVMEQEAGRKKGDRTAHRYSFRIIHKSGAVRWVEIHSIWISCAYRVG